MFAAGARSGLEATTGSGSGSGFGSGSGAGSGVGPCSPRTAASAPSSGEVDLDEASRSFSF